MKHVKELNKKIKRNRMN